VGGRCQVAKATYCDILERRARENAVDFVEGVATALTSIAFFETFMVKSCETPCRLGHQGRCEHRHRRGESAPGRDRVQGLQHRYRRDGGTDSTAPGPMCMSSAWRVFADRTGIGWTVTGHGCQQWAVRIT
jgi:hypothetical protein